MLKTAMSELSKSLVSCNKCVSGAISVGFLLNDAFGKYYPFPCHGTYSHMLHQSPMQNIYMAKIIKTK